jgi:hypothetical protein
VDCDAQADGGTRRYLRHSRVARPFPLVAAKKIAAHPLTDFCAISVGVVDALRR